MKKDFILVLTSEFLRDSAEHLVATFGIIYFYIQFNSILLAVVPFALMHLLQGLLIKPVTYYIGKLGTRKSVIVGISFYILSLIPLYFFSFNQNYLFLIFWSLLTLSGSLFYYVPKIFLFGVNTTYQGRGSQISSTKILSIVNKILYPLAGALATTLFGFAGLIIVAIVLYISSIIPQIFIDSHIFELDYNNSSDVNHRKLIQLNFLEINSIELNRIWPVFLFIIVGSSFSDLGILLSIVAIVNITFIYILGKKLIPEKRYSYLKFVSITNLFGWITRLFAISYLTALISDIVFSVTRNLNTNILEVINYDLMNADEGLKQKVIGVVAREKWRNIFIAGMYIWGGIVITLFGFQASCIIAALLGLVFLSIKE